VRRGDVVPFKGRPDARGREQRGNRYAVVLQTNALEDWSTVVVAPTTTRPLGAFFRPPVVIRGNQSHVLLDQVVALDRSRLGRVTGTLSPGEMESVEKALRFVLGLV
jgi:mRNA interferase MazF